jgi:hypothetical protein
MTNGGGAIARLQKADYDKLDSITHHHDAIAYLIRHCRCRKIIEIGVWKSGMVKHVMRTCEDVIDEYWMVDPWMYLGDGFGRMGRRPQENWDYIHLYACSLMTKWYPQLRVIRAQSTPAAGIFDDGGVDLIYIDANHFYKDVLADITAWRPKVSSTGIFAGHDYGVPNHPGVKKAVDEVFGEDGVFASLNCGVWIRK